jgi:hypothetical protein
LDAVVPARLALRLCALVALAAACNGGGRTTLIRTGDPPEVREACSRAELRCSSCHTLDRIFSFQGRGRGDWEQEVRRMRLKPASGITVADAGVIVGCLVRVDAGR